MVLEPVCCNRFWPAVVSLAAAASCQYGIIIAIYYIISYLDKEEPPPDQASAIIYTETLAYKELSNNLNLKT